MLLSARKNKTIIVAGGDLRQVTVAKLFKEDNQVYCIGFEQNLQVAQEQRSIEALILLDIRPDYIILPMPATIDNDTVNTPFSSHKLLLSDVFSLATESTIIYGGKLSSLLKAQMNALGLHYVDYLEREELAVLNAVPTAEGALQIAMEELPTTIYGMVCLIVGYGRIGNVLAKYFKALGADVYVSARKYKDLAWISIDGYKPVRTENLKEHIAGKQIIINTVPAMVLTEEILRCTPSDCLLIDLASKPGGIDLNIANSLGLKAIWALSLPGKVAPITAGKIVYETIQNIEAERSLTNDAT